MQQQQDSDRSPPATPRSPLHPNSLCFFFSSAAAANPTASSRRCIAIAIVVRWAVDHYLRPGNAVILLHVRPTSVLYGADWGSVDVSHPSDQESQQKLEDDFDASTTTKVEDLARPLVESQFPFKIHIVKDHDMKERLCLEVERLQLSVVIMGSRGFGRLGEGGKEDWGVSAIIMCITAFVLWW